MLLVVSKKRKSSDPLAPMPMQNTLKITYQLLARVRVGLQAMALLMIHGARNHIWSIRGLLSAHGTGLECSNAANITTRRIDRTTRIACLSVESCFFLLEILTSWQSVRHRDLGISQIERGQSAPSSILDYDIMISKAGLCL